MKKIQRILIITPRFHTNLLPIVRAFKEAKFDIEVVARRREIIEDYSDVNPLVLEALEKPEKDFEIFVTQYRPQLTIFRADSYKFWKVYLKILRKTDSLIYFYDQRPIYVTSPLAAKIGATISAVRRLVRGMHPNRLTPVIGPTEGYRSAFSSYFSYPVNFAGPQKDGSVAVADTPKKILCVGKLAVPRKRHDLLIQSLLRLKVPFELKIIGALEDDFKSRTDRDFFYYERLKHNISLLRQLGTVEVLTNISHHAMGEHFRAADIFVLPSEREPFSISVLEAMSFGCAILAPSDNGSSQFILHGTNGLIFDSRSPEDFLQKLEILITKDEFRQKLGRNAVASVSEFSTYSNFLTDLRKIIPGL